MSILSMTLCVIAVVTNMNFLGVDDAVFISFQIILSFYSCYSVYSSTGDPVFVSFHMILFLLHTV